MTMESRAIQVSHELWKEMMTQGYESSGLKCIKGLPRNAKLVFAFYHRMTLVPDPVYVFESEAWDSPVPEYFIEHDGVKYPIMDVIFEQRV